MGWLDIKFLYGGNCLLYRVADHPFRGIFADMAVGEMQCLRDQRMNDGVNPQMGALHLLNGAFQNFEGNVAHGGPHIAPRERPKGRLANLPVILRRLPTTAERSFFGRRRTLPPF